ncbi:uncharacterized protein LOC143450495 [Clavelina lepadiformis]|uniref:uncharacterized protein LOC143450495 n=1 Tax=Clavelina lepadiformis TaxID=159417 RepID=UPI004042DEFB
MKDRLSIMGIISCILGLTTFAFGIISLITARWRWNHFESIEEGLFQVCRYEKTTKICENLNLVPYLQVTQAFMMMGLVLTVLAFTVTLEMTFMKGTKNIHKASGSLFCVTGLFFLVACVVYTGFQSLYFSLDNGYSFGYSFWLAWISVILPLLGTPAAFLTKNQTFIV